MKGFYGLLLLFCLGITELAGSTIGNDIVSLGIPPQEVKYFLSERINCKDGSKFFYRDRVNDDFCDCPDGTDEPGTSACPEGKFYCRNAGYIPVLLFSSRVNDGICDCCDGSDEYDGKVKCSNTCWESGKATREKLRRKLTTYKEGFRILKQEIEHAKQMMTRDKAELTSLKEEEKKLKNLVNKLKDSKEAIEKVEEQERLKREKEEQRISEAEKQAEEQERLKREKVEQEILQSRKSSSEDSHPIPKEGPESSDQAGNRDNENHVEVEQVHIGTTDDEVLEDRPEEEEHEKQVDTEGLSREELGRLVASRWTGEDPSRQRKERMNDHTGHKEHDEKMDDEDSEHSEEYDEDSKHSEEHDEDKKHVEEYDDYSSEYEDVEKTHEDEDDESENKVEEDENVENDDIENSESYEESEETPDLSTHATLSWWGRLWEGFQLILRAVKLSRVSVDMTEAERIKKDYNDLSRKLSKLQSRISNLEKKLKQDYGKEGEFYTFYDQCFELKENKYIYKICPYKEASQNEGHSTTSLGRWGGFKDSFRSMEFTNGDKCWNGPDRSLKIRLKCGLNNELVDVDEPSRCEYVASLLTPAVCLEERLKELQRRLDSLNQENQTHDEL